MSKQQIPENIREFSRKRATKFYGRSDVRQPHHYRIGQIWSTKSHIILGNGQSFSTNQPRIVVILDSEEDTLVAAPISIETQMAGPYDFLLRGETSPLDFDFLIEVWNETPVIQAHLNRFIAEIDNDVLELVKELHAAYLFDEEITSLKSYTGSFLYEKDERLEFQASEVDAIRYLSQAATFSLTIQQTAQVTSKKQILDFGIPTLRSLGQLLNPQRSGVAFASGGDDLADKGYVISYGDKDPTIIQINVSKRRDVYLLVHQVSQELKNQSAVISLTINNVVLQSEATELVVGKRIELGEYIGFKSNNVSQSVKVEIL